MTPEDKIREAALLKMMAKTLGYEMDNYEAVRIVESWNMEETKP